MNLEELEEALEELLPGFQISTDKHGQIIIYTGMIQDEDGELLTMDDDDGESSFDDDTEQLDDEEFDD